MCIRDRLKIEELPEERKKEYAENIESAASRLSTLISNILKLNKLENQRITPEVEAYDVCRQLCECILSFEEAWEEKGIELDTQIEDSCMVKADESLLELVWNNLLSNAVKFTEPGGQICVKQALEGKYVTVAISDTGCGMDEEGMKPVSYTHLILLSEEEVRAMDEALDHMEMSAVFGGTAQVKKGGNI